MMRACLFLICALAASIFSGNAVAATSTTDWHSYNTTYNQAPSADENQNQNASNDQAQIFSVYAGRQSYAPETVVEEQGNLHSPFDAVRVGVNLKFD